MRSTRDQLKGRHDEKEHDTRNNYRVNPGGVIERTRFDRVSPERVRFVMRNRRCRYDELNANIRDCARKRLVVVSPSPKLVALLEEKNRQRVSFSLSIFSFSLFFQLPPPFRLPSVEGSSLSLTLIRTYRSGIGDRGGSMKGKVPHEGGGHLVVYRTSS